MHGFKIGFESGCVSGLLAREMGIYVCATGCTVGTCSLHLTCTVAINYGFSLLCTMATVQRGIHYRKIMHSSSDPWKICTGHSN